MKNNKNLRTIFHIIPIVCAAMLIMFTIFWVNAGPIGALNARAATNYSSLWTNDEDMNVVINWKIGGIYLAVLLIALSFTIFNLVKFVIPSKDKILLTFNICSIVSLIAIVMAMFLPYCMKWGAIDTDEVPKKIAIAVQALIYMGTPLLLVSSITNIVIDHRVNK